MRTERSDGVVRHLLDGGEIVHADDSRSCPWCDDEFEQAEGKACDHVDTGRVRKFDGGRLPVLCGRCRTILSWDR